MKIIWKSMAVIGIFILASCGGNGGEETQGNGSEKDQAAMDSSTVIELEQKAKEIQEEGQELDSLLEVL